MPVDGNTELGDKFTDVTGRELIVVDHAQRRQTVGYWVDGTSHHGVTDMVARRTWSKPTGGPMLLGWATNPAAPTAAANAFRSKWAKGRLCLCAVNELDEQENEFGTVSP